MTEDTDLYDDVKSAFAAAEELQDEPVSAEAEEKSPEQSIEETVRDEHGRFIKKETDDVKAEPVAEQPAPVEPVALSAEKPPQSWTPAAREKWLALDPDIRQEIIRREEASANGVRQIQERFAPMQQFVDSMRPIAQEAQTLGMRPDQYIYNLAQSERTLRSAEMPAKFQEILRIADQYGVPLREVINQSVGQEVIKAPQQQAAIPPEFQREIHEMRQWRENVERQNVNQSVVLFSDGKEFFEDVRMQMADLVERGIAQDLNAAYDMACWSNPQVREVLISRQGKEQLQNTISSKQSKAKGASIPAAGKVAVPETDDDDDDVADTVRKAWASAQGRV